MKDIYINKVLCKWEADNAWWVATKRLSCICCGHVTWTYAYTLITTSDLATITSGSRPTLTKISDNKYIAHCFKDPCRTKVKVSLVCPEI